MAAGNTKDIRVHVMGDLYMLTGTFTDGGTDVYFGDHLSNVLAAGGHATSVYDTGVKINNGGGYAVGETGALAVDAVDVRLHFNVGETIYNSAGARVGVLTAIGSAVAITCGGGLVTAVADNANLYKLGGPQPAVTLEDGTLQVSIDETNKYVNFSNGNMGARSTASTTDGRWLVLGQR